MEPQDINYLINKYSRTPKSSQNEEFYSSPRSSFSPFHEPNSKAYAAAMRALQERIRFLESENTDLYEKFRISEAKLLEEKKVSEKLSQELHSKTNNEVYSTQTISELKNEVSRLKKQNTQLNYELSALENNKSNHLLEENLNLKHELDLTMRELSNKKASDISLLMEIRKLEDEKFALQDELSKEKWRAKEVYEENRDTLERLKNLEHAEAELLRRNEAYDRTVKDLEYRCRYLEDLNTRSKSPASRRSQKDLKNSQKTVSFRKSRSKSRTDKLKTSKSTSPSSPFLSKPQNRHIGAHLLESGEFSDKINKMELELEELHKHYKRLLNTSKNETNGLSKIRIEIDRLAAELENKGKMIYNLKNKQT